MFPSWKGEQRYHTPTWVDYIRHNQRSREADAVIGERLRALHQGGELQATPTMTPGPMR